MNFKDTYTELCQIAKRVAKDATGQAPPPMQYFDEIAGFETDEVNQRLGLPKDAPHLPILTVPDHVYNRFSAEICAMKKPDNWKARITYRKQFVALFWNKKYKRIHSKNHFIVSFSAWSDAMNDGTENRVRVEVTPSAVAAAVEASGAGETSDTVHSVNIRAKENELLKH